MSIFVLKAIVGDSCVYLLSLIFILFPKTLSVQTYLLLK